MKNYDRAISVGYIEISTARDTPSIYTRHCFKCPNFINITKYNHTFVRCILLYFINRFILLYFILFDLKDVSL